MNGIQMYYLVALKNRNVTPSVSTLQSTISNAVNKGVFLKVLRTYGGVNFANAIALYPSFVDISPTNAPTKAPSYKPTFAPSQPTVAPSQLNQYRTNVPTRAPTSAVPSYEPTQPVFIVLATQGIAGVSVATAQTTTFQTSFKATVADSLGLSASSITITSISASSRRLEASSTARFMEISKKSGSENTLQTIGQDALSEMIGAGKSAVVSSSSGVNVVYTIKADATITLTTVTTKLETAVTAGTFTTALVSAGFTSASGMYVHHNREIETHS